MLHVCLEGTVLARMERSEQSERHSSVYVRQNSPRLVAGRDCSYRLRMSRVLSIMSALPATGRVVQPPREGQEIPSFPPFLIDKL
jgi:hypothetical protein